jgi:drug/metabolite transporter (DMT)-like permease
VLAATLFWGVSATLARFMFRDRRLPPLTVVEMRLVVAVVLLVVWLSLRRRDLLRIRRDDAGYFVVLGVFGVAAMQGSYYYGISVLGVGLAILLQYIAPALILAYGALRGERIGPLAAGAVVAALAGTALLVGGVDRAALHAGPLAWAVGFGSAFVFAFYILFSKRALRRYAPETVLLYTFAIAALFWACVTPPWVIARAAYGRDVWLLFLAIGVSSTLVPFAFFYAGLRRLSPAQTGLLATVEPLVAVLSAWLILGEGLKPVQWAGAALVLAASALASQRMPERAPAEAERA